MDYLAIAPHLTLTSSILILMLFVGFWRHHLATMVLTVVGFVATFIALFPALDASPRAVTPLMQLDSFAAFFNAMFLIIAAQRETNRKQQIIPACCLLAREEQSCSPQKFVRFFGLSVKANGGPPAAGPRAIPVCFWL